MATSGGNFDGQAYNLGPADSLDQQDTKGRGTATRKLVGRRLLGASLGDPQSLLQRLIQASLGYGVPFGSKANT